MNAKHEQLAIARSKRRVGDDKLLQAMVWMEQLTTQHGWTKTRVMQAMGYKDASSWTKIMSGDRSLGPDKYRALEQHMIALNTPQRESAPEPTNRLAEANGTHETQRTPVCASRSVLSDLQAAQETLRSLSRRLEQTETRAVALLRPGLRSFRTRLEALADELEV